MVQLDHLSEKSRDAIERNNKFLDEFRNYKFSGYPVDQSKVYYHLDPIDIVEQITTQTRINDFFKIEAEKNQQQSKWNFIKDDYEILEFLGEGTYG